MRGINYKLLLLLIGLGFRFQNGYCRYCRTENEVINLILF